MHFYWQSITAENPMPCHMQVDYEEVNWQEQLPFVDLCAGMLIHFVNICKVPRRPQIAEAVRGVRRSPLVFRTAMEFFAHHMRRADAGKIAEAVRRATFLPSIPPDKVS